MKKLILMFGVITSIVFNSNAQEEPDARNAIRFGIKSGVNYANVYDTQGEAFNADAKLGFVAGGFFSIPIGMFLGFQPEVLYSQKGFQATGKLLGADYKFSRTSTYIDVPLMLAVRPFNALTLLVGPQYSYLIKQKDVFENGSASIEQEQAFKNENIRKNIFGVIGGIDFNQNHLVLGLRAGWDILKNNGDGTSITPRYKNVWYQLTLGVRI